MIYVVDAGMALIYNSLLGTVSPKSSLRSDLYD
jgi:hypothetical protein